jgi:hypothetical protein
MDHAVAEGSRAIADRVHNASHGVGGLVAKITGAMHDGLECIRRIVRDRTAEVGCSVTETASQGRDFVDSKADGRFHAMGNSVHR